jgi:uncharacterized membrane protein YedE/YeeE
VKPYQYVSFFLVGIFFGIVLSKAEVVSWYRIQEMFRFQSFHMYGIIGSAVALGVVIVQLIKRRRMQAVTGEEIIIPPKAKSVPRYLLGGTFFGAGWALTGACPGPLFILVGNGLTVMLVAILSAMAGTLAYGLLRDRLPH